MSTPMRRPPVIFSSRVSRWATRTVNRGVVAFRIEANPEAMWDCAQTISENGTTLLRKPMLTKATQILPLRGIRAPVTATAIHSIAAARPTRTTTTVKVGSSLTATPLKKNDPPHRADRATRSSHSSAVMERFCSQGAVIRCGVLCKRSRVRRTARLHLPVHAIVFGAELSERIQPVPGNRCDRYL
jgi:hypothetical protein